MPKPPMISVLKQTPIADPACSCVLLRYCDLLQSHPPMAHDCPPRRSNFLAVLAARTTCLQAFPRWATKGG
jgi:hypothetical protein